MNISEKKIIKAFLKEINNIIDKIVDPEIKRMDAIYDRIQNEKEIQFPRESKNYIGLKHKEAMEQEEARLKGKMITISFTKEEIELLQETDENVLKRLYGEIQENIYSIKNTKKDTEKETKGLEVKSLEKEKKELEEEKKTTIKKYADL